MPKTKKLFDWEVYDKDGDMIDVLTMTRHRMKEYQESHPDQTIKEIGYHDGEDDTWESSSDKDRNLYSVRVSRRRR